MQNNSPILICLLAVASIRCAAQPKNGDLRAEISRNVNGILILDLGRQGNPTDIDFLKSLKSENPFIQRQIKKALARLGDGLAFLDIAAGCYQSDGVQQHQAFGDLEYVGGERSIRVLLDRLTDTIAPPHELDMEFPPPAVEAVWSLSKLVSNGPVTVTSPDREGAERGRPLWIAFARQYASISTPFVKDAGATLLEGVAQRNAVAVLVLGRLADARLLPSVQEHLRAIQDNQNLRSALLMVAARLGDQVAFEKIVARLVDSDSKIQNEAVDQVAYSGGERAIRSLARLVTQIPPPEQGAPAEPVKRKAGEPLPVDVKGMQGLAHLIPDYPVWATIQNRRNARAVWSQWLAERGFLDK